MASHHLLCALLSASPIPNENKRLTCYGRLLCHAGVSIANDLVSRHLAACVNIVPGVESIYFWDGKVNQDAELLLIIKTRASLLEALTAAVKAKHPYDTPEVLALPAAGGSVTYLKWVADSTSEPQ